LLLRRKRKFTMAGVMSEMCHERTRAVQQKELLLNDLVRKTHVRKIEPECLGGLEIDRQFKLRWLHDRQFGRLFALENSSDVDACLTPGVQSAGAVTRILREPGSGTRSMFEAALKKFGIKLSDLDIRLELPSNEAMRVAV